MRCNLLIVGHIDGGLTGAVEFVGQGEAKLFVEAIAATSGDLISVIHIAT